MSRVKDNIRYLRRLHSYTQQQLADKIGITRSSLGAYEEGRAEVRTQVLEQMAALFGVSINELISQDLAKGATTGTRVRNPAQVQPVLPSSPETAPFLHEPVQPAPAPYPAAGGAMPAPAGAQPPVYQNGGQQPSERLAGIKLRMLALTTDKHGVPDVTLVTHEQLVHYPHKFSEPEYLATLPNMHLPQLDRNQVYRAFYFTGNNVIPHIAAGSTAICRYIRNWYELNGSQLYVLVSKTLGIIVSPIANKLSSSNEIWFAVTGTTPDRPLPAGDLLEVWEVSQWLTVNNSMSKPMPSGLDRYLADIQHQLNELRSMVGKQGEQNR